MNYPIKVKSVFTHVCYQVQDAWQNLRILKRHISSLVRSIDDVASRVNRSRQLLQEIGAPQHTESTTAATGSSERLHDGYTAGAFR